MMEHLVSGTEALPNMAEPNATARFLLHHMLQVSKTKSGIHVFLRMTR